MKPMTEQMKEELQQRRLSREIYAKIHAKRRTKFPKLKRKTWILPEEFTGKDLKYAKKLMKKQKRK
jgi:hypothetical protein